jgi:hypothetical protein
MVHNPSLLVMCGGINVMCGFIVLCLICTSESKVVKFAVKPKEPVPSKFEVR